MAAGECGRGRHVCYFFFIVFFSCKLLKLGAKNLQNLFDGLLHQDYKCAACEQLMRTVEIDHKVRVADGGSNDISNLQALCPSCHSLKTQLERINSGAMRRVAEDGLCHFRMFLLL